MSTAVNSIASSLLPLSEVQVRHESKAPIPLQQEKRAPLDEMNRTTWEAIDRDVKFWEHKVLQAD